eukprot:gene4857-biopygen4771
MKTSFRNDTISTALSELLMLVNPTKSVKRIVMLWCVSAMGVSPDFSRRLMFSGRMFASSFSDCSKFFATCSVLSTRPVSRYSLMAGTDSMTACGIIFNTPLVPFSSCFRLLTIFRKTKT